MIHPTAIIHPKAQLDSTVSVGPCAVIDEHVRIGPHCRIGPHAHLTGHTTVGANNTFHTGCVMGDAPQDLKYQGEPAISKDLPPFCVARGDNGICGLNAVGLRRAGFNAEDRIELKRLYHALFRSGQKLSAAITAARKEFTSEGARALLDFVASSQRGICPDTGTPERDLTQDE